MAAHRVTAECVFCPHVVWASVPPDGTNAVRLSSLNAELDGAVTSLHLASPNGKFCDLPWRSQYGPSAALKNHTEKTPPARNAPEIARCLTRPVSFITRGALLLNRLDLSSPLFHVLFMAIVGSVGETMAV